MENSLPLSGDSGDAPTPNPAQLALPEALEAWVTKTVERDVDRVVECFRRNGRSARPDDQIFAGFSLATILSLSNRLKAAEWSALGRSDFSSLKTPGYDGALRLLEDNLSVPDPELVLALAQHRDLLQHELDACVWPRHVERVENADEAVQQTRQETLREALADDPDLSSKTIDTILHPPSRVPHPLANVHHLAWRPFYQGLVDFRAPSIPPASVVVPLPATVVPRPKTRNHIGPVDTAKPLLSEKEAAALINWSRRWLAEKRRNGEIPAALYRRDDPVGNVHYHTAKVLEWIAHPERF